MFFASREDSLPNQVFLSEGSDAGLWSREAYPCRLPWLPMFEGILIFSDSWY